LKSRVKLKLLRMQLIRRAMKRKKESAARWVSVLYRHGQSYIDSKLRPIGLGKGQYLFLIKLYENDGLRQDDLATILKFDKATVARAISRMEKNGFITRKTDPEDRRAKRVYLTGRAIEVKPVLLNILYEWTDTLVDSFTESEKKDAISLLIRMATNAANAVESPARAGPEKKKGMDKTE